MVDELKFNLEKRPDTVFLDKKEYKVAQKERKAAEKKLAGELMQQGLSRRDAKREARLQLCEEYGINVLAPKNIRKAYDKAIEEAVSNLDCTAASAAYDSAAASAVATTARPVSVAFSPLLPVSAAGFEDASAPSSPYAPNVHLDKKF